MDNYTEQIIEKKPGGREYSLLAGAIGVVVVGVFLTMFVSFGLGIAVAFVGGMLVYFSRQAQASEYEYLFINADCDIARITNKTTRKEIFSFKGGDVSRVLAYKDLKFQNELQVNGELDVVDFTSGKKEEDSKWYAFLVNANNGTKAVVLELNDKTLSHVQTYFKNKFN